MEPLPHDLISPRLYLPSEEEEEVSFVDEVYLGSRAIHKCAKRVSRNNVQKRGQLQYQWNSEIE